MEERIKNIVSQYTKIPAEQITVQTVIDRSTVASSIILHRMYAQLANEGIVVADYPLVKTFGQLLANVNGKEIHAVFTETLPATNYLSTENIHEALVGIDIENINAMPVVNDFREDEFYKMNFAPTEIAHCILQPNPYASFAGLFAIKEAIIKADNSYKNKPFHSITITHLPEGKPLYNGFQISISHTNETAIAMAVKSSPASTAVIPNPHNNSYVIATAAIAAFVFSLFTLILFLIKSC